MSRRGCPHGNRADCPLYVAAHVPGYGCDDGNLGEGRCAVDRGRLSYDREVRRFRLEQPREWAVFRFLNDARREREEAAARLAQRRRNLQMNPIH